MRLATIAAVILAEIIAVHVYNSNSNLIHNVSWSTFTQSYLPSWQYRLTRHNVGGATKSDASSIPVLAYHGLIANADQSNMLVKDFRAQMFALKEAGWQTVSMDDYIAFVQGKKRLPAKSFLLTFDDGRKDSYYNADPILKALNYHAAMFVIAHHALYEGNASTYYLNKSELQKMIASKRWDIEGHSFNAHDLIRVSEDGKKGDFYSNYLWVANKDRQETQDEYQTRVKRDIENTQQSLESQLHIRVRAFAYPFGDYGQETLNNAGAASFVLGQVNKQYAVAFSQENVDNNTTQNYFGSGGQSSTRIEPSYYWTSDNLLKMMQVGSGKMLPYNDTFSDVEGWMNIEGSYKLNLDHSMELSADPSNTSAGVLLDGTQAWSDYSYSLRLTRSGSSQVSLLARYASSQNYIACVFAGDRISVRQVLNDKTTTVSYATQGVDEGEQELGVAVHGDQLACRVNDSTVLDTPIIESVQKGMVGISVWSSNKGVADMRVRQFQAKAN